MILIQEEEIKMTETEETEVLTKKIVVNMRSTEEMIKTIGK